MMPTPNLLALCAPEITMCYCSQCLQKFNMGDGVKKVITHHRSAGQNATETKYFCCAAHREEWTNLNVRKAIPKTKRQQYHRSSWGYHQ